MLKEDNRCHFEFIKPWAGMRVGGVWYGYAVTFRESSGCEFTGVLIPNLRSSTWELAPMDCVTIIQQPKEPITGPPYEVDE